MSHLQLFSSQAVHHFLPLLAVLLGLTSSASNGQTEKPVLHGRHWMAITGKPLGAMAGAKIFEAGGNAVRSRAHV